MRTKVYVSGRFLTRPLSGVDRVAEEIVSAWAQMPADRSGSSFDIELLHPNSSARTVSSIPSSRGVTKGLFWEHFELPLSARNAWLLSPCNTGPLAHSRQAVIIHDAQPFSNPDAYSRAFRTWYHLLLPELARRARLVLTVSEFSKGELERYGIVPRGKAEVIHNGGDHIDRIAVDQTTLARHGLTAGGYLLAIGNLSPHKNLAMLTRAREAMPPGSPPLVIAGGANSRIFNDAGIKAGENVRVLGRVTDEELKALYSNAIAFLFPSLTEGFGIPPLEAMRCGCAVLATNAGAVPEVCSDAVLSLSPHDQEAWTSAMTEIVSSRDLRERLQKAGTERTARFTWENAARRLSDLLRHADKI